MGDVGRLRSRPKLSLARLGLINRERGDKGGPGGGSSNCCFPSAGGREFVFRGGRIKGEKGGGLNRARVIRRISMADPH